MRIQSIVPVMRAQGGGKIINVAASVRAAGVVSGVADYAAAKGGIIALTRNAASELASPTTFKSTAFRRVRRDPHGRLIYVLFAFRQHLGEPAATFGNTKLATPEVVAPAFVFFAWPLMLTTFRVRLLALLMAD